MEMLVLKLGPNEWFKQFAVSGEKDTTPVLGEAHFFAPSQLDSIKERLCAQEPYAQIFSVQVSEPSLVWDVHGGDSASQGIRKMSLGGEGTDSMDSPAVKTTRNEMLKWAASHSDMIDVWAFSQDRSVSYHTMLQVCRSLVGDGYLLPVKESLAICHLTPKGEAAASALK